jgi:hypothetical protein
MQHSPECYRPKKREDKEERGMNGGGKEDLNSGMEKDDGRQEQTSKFIQGLLLFV